MAPDVAARCSSGCDRQRLLNGVPQPHEAERFSETGNRAMLLHNRAEPVFLEGRNDNDRRRIFTRIQGFQDRHPVYSGIYIQDDGAYIFEIIMAEVEELLRCPDETDIAANACCGAGDRSRGISICIQNQNNVSFHEILRCRKEYDSARNALPAGWFFLCKNCSEQKWLEVALPKIGEVFGKGR
jgi:hypothetical protein